MKFGRLKQMCNLDPYESQDFNSFNKFKVRKLSDISDLTFFNSYSQKMTTFLPKSVTKVHSFISLFVFLSILADQYSFRVLCSTKYLQQSRPR